MSDSIAICLSINRHRLFSIHCFILRCVAVHILWFHVYMYSDLTINLKIISRKEKQFNINNKKCFWVSSLLRQFQICFQLVVVWDDHLFTSHFFQLSSSFFHFFCVFFFWCRLAIRIILVKNSYRNVLINLCIVQMTNNVVDHFGHGPGYFALGCPVDVGDLDFAVRVQHAASSVRLFVADVRPIVFGGPLVSRQSECEKNGRTMRI